MYSNPKTRSYSNISKRKGTVRKGHELVQYEKVTNSYSTKRSRKGTVRKGQSSLRAKTIARRSSCSQRALSVPRRLSCLNPVRTRALGPPTHCAPHAPQPPPEKRVPQAAPASSCSSSPCAHPSSMDAKQHKSGHRRCRLSFRSYTLISD